MKPGLESGILSVNDDNGKESDKAYVITALDENDLPQIMALQDIIVRHLHCSRLLEPLSSEFMSEHLGRRGFVLGVFSQGTLVGFRNVYFPRARDPELNLGRDIDLPDPQLQNVANFQMICVHPQYRGNGLALKMNWIALRLLREHGNHYHICATVSPQNIWNISILLESGFHIRVLKPKYGGKMRYIVYQRLKDPIEFHKKVVARISLDALDTQKQLLRTGYYAVDMMPERIAEGSISQDTFQWDLLFRQPVEEPKVLVVPARSVGQARPAERIPADQPVDDSLPPGKSDDIDSDKGR